jgi:hypothetical protein
MKLQLILAGPYTSCAKTRQVWQSACEKHHLGLEVMGLEHTEGKALADRLDINTFPALVVDGKIKAIGHPDEHSASRLVALLTDSRA